VNNHPQSHASCEPQYSGVHHSRHITWSIFWIFPLRYKPIYVSFNIQGEKKRNRAETDG